MGHFQVKGHLLINPSNFQLYLIDYSLLGITLSYVGSTHSPYVIFFISVYKTENKNS